MLLSSGERISRLGSEVRGASTVHPCFRKAIKNIATADAQLTADTDAPDED
jgi:hypothetical protein